MHRIVIGCIDEMKHSPNDRFERLRSHFPRWMVTLAMLLIGACSSGVPVRGDALGAFQEGEASNSVEPQEPRDSEVYIVAVKDDEYRWNFKLTPYLWTPSLKGEVALAPGAPGGTRDLARVPILALRGEARYGPFGLLLDIGRSKFDTKQNPNAATEVDLDVDVLVINAWASYRFLEVEDFWLEALAGARVFSLESDWKVTMDPDPPAFFSADETWTDPIFGLRTRIEPAPRLFFDASGNVGIGGQSESSWEAYGALGYQLSDLVSLELGYRYLQIDFDSSGRIYDATQEGILFGVGFSF